MGEGLISRDPLTEDIHYHSVLKLRVIDVVAKEMGTCLVFFSLNHLPGSLSGQSEGLGVIILDLLIWKMVTVCSVQGVGSSGWSVRTDQKDISVVQKFTDKMYTLITEIPGGIW